MATLISPKALHQRAVTRTAADIAKSSPLFQKIVQVVNEHSGVNFVELVICGVRTHEFAFFDIGDDVHCIEAKAIAEHISSFGYYTEMRALNDDRPDLKSLIVCWDPQVLKLSATPPRLDS